MDLEILSRKMEISTKKFEEEDFFSVVKSKLQELKEKFTDIGISPQPLFDVVHQLIDEEELRNSPIDFGLCTVNVSDFKVEKLFKEDIPQGQLKDYIIASCYLPIFKMLPLHGKYYIDGGFGSQAPVDMIVKKGLIPIVVRLHIRPSRDDLSQAKYVITPSTFLGSVMNFDTAKADVLMRMGYFDTYRTIKGLVGKKYYIHPISEEQALTYLYRLLQERYPKDERPFMRKLVEETIPKLAKDFNFDDNYDYRNVLYRLLEYYGDQKKLEPLRIYTVEEMIKELS